MGAAANSKYSRCGYRFCYTVLHFSIFYVDFIFCISNFYYSTTEYGLCSMLYFCVSCEKMQLLSHNHNEIITCIRNLVTDSASSVALVLQENEKTHVKKGSLCAQLCPRLLLYLVYMQGSSNLYEVTVLLLTLESVHNLNSQVLWFHREDT